MCLPAPIVFVVVTEINLIELSVEQLTLETACWKLLQLQLQLQLSAQRKISFSGLFIKQTQLLILVRF